MKLRHNIFVSSTFQDMHFERDMLHGIVVPELISRFSKKHINIDLIDLRWGIDTSGESSEQENTVKILKVCFDEIERSKPFFIGFIGERYGWIPNSNDIESAILGYNFDSQGRDMSITEMEMLYALQKFDSPENCLFFIRNGICPEDIDNEQVRNIYFPNDNELKERCDSLKAYLRDRYASTTFDYHCYWDKETSTIKGLEGLCELVTEKLSELIEKELGSLFNENVSILGEEKLLQESVLRDIQENTFGRKSEINDLVEFAKSGSGNELLVSATSGLGKSSLIASFCKEYENEALVIPFFAGISARSTDFHFLARYIYSVLTGNDDDSILDIPYKELKKRLLGALFDASSDKQVVIVVDALDQFASSKELNELDFVSEQLLPKNVKIIYSALPDFEACLNKRNASIYALDSLSPTDIKTVATGIASKLHKELSPTVLDLLASKCDESGSVVCKAPIYLVLLLELLCSFDSDDFAEINKSQSNENLSPAVAIQKYLERCIQKTGTKTKDVLNAISAKTISQLGSKYDIITALLTSSPNGISERDIIGITALTGDAVSATDFSLYRRMFRMHLVQRENECWVFNHAIIRSTLTDYAQGLDCKELFEACAKYYISQPNDTSGRCAGIVRFLGKLKKYDELIPYALSGDKGATFEITSLLISSGATPVLDACSNEQVFALCSLVLDYISEATVSSFEELLRLCITAIKKMQGINFKEEQNAKVLSSYYFFCANLLIENGDSRARSFFELSTGILKKACISEPLLASRLALKISDIFTARDDRSVSERYASIAYKIARKHINNSSSSEELQFFANVCYTLNNCVQENPLSMKKHRRSKYIATALKIGARLENHDLLVRCALEYLTLPSIFRNKQKSMESRACIENADDKCLSVFTYVEKELSLATFGDSVLHTKRAYDASILALAQDNSKNSMLLYERSLEDYLYHLMLSKESSVDTAYDIWQRTDKILKKLTLITSDITFTDKRLAICNDFEAYSRQRGEKATQGEQKQEILDRISKERKSKNNDFKRKKDVYRSLAIKLGIVGFLLYAIVQFIGFSFSQHESDLIIQLILLISNITETIANIILAVMIFFGFLLIYSHEKNSFNYESDTKSLTILSSFFSLFFILSMFFHIYNRRIIYQPAGFEIRILGEANALFHSVILAFAVIWFIVYAFAIPVCNPFKYSVQEKLRYKYRFNEIILRYVKIILLSAIPLISFIPYAFVTPRYGLDVSIDMFYTTPRMFLKYCYVPLILQLILSGTELFVMYKHYGKPQRVIRGKGALIKNKGAFIKYASIACSFLVICTGCIFISKDIFKKQLHEEYGYTMTDDFSYHVTGGKAVIRKYYGNDAHVRIPSTIDGYEVASIKDSAFENNNDIISVTIPEGITEVGSYVFRNCKNLKEVQLPSTVVAIESYAFEDCASLERVTTASTEYIKISSEAFYESNIFSTDEVKATGFYIIGNNIGAVDKERISGALHIPNGIKIIDSSVFSNCTRITELYIPSSVTAIHSSAFSGCSSLYYVNLGAGVTEISSNAFNSCTRLTLIDNNSSLELECGSTENGAIAKNAIYISKNNDALSGRDGDYIFAYDSKADSYTLVVGNECATQLILPKDYKGEKYLIHEFFIPVTAEAVNVVIPSGYSWNYTKTFGRTHLYRVDIDTSTMTYHNGIPCFINDDAKTIVFCRPSNTLSTVTIDKIQGYEDYSYLIKNSAFEDRKYDKLSINCSCDIGMNAFIRCTFTNGINIVGETVNLQSYSFKDTDVPSLVINASDVKISTNAFAQSSIESVEINSEKTSIYNSFAYCENLKSVKLKGDASITSYAFQSCISLESLDLTNCIELGNYAFANASNLKSIYLSNKLESIANSTFTLAPVVNVYFDGTAQEWNDVLSYLEEDYKANIMGRINLYIDNVLVSGATSSNTN